jgi:hypothetical protein
MPFLAVQVLQWADCPAGGDGNFAARARKNGSSGTMRVSASSSVSNQACVWYILTVQVLQSADCQAGDSNFAARARKKGSFRDHEPGTVQRLVDAYEVSRRNNS